MYIFSYLISLIPVHQFHSFFGQFELNVTVLLVLACILACKLKTKSKKISYLAESLRIEILMMIGYGDRSQTQALKSLIAEVHQKCLQLIEVPLAKSKLNIGSWKLLEVLLLHLGK